jgi:phenylalanyl-tRNA synthetase alpha chain
VDAYFPFTHPSFELEIYYEGKWVEMLGCGVIHDFVLARSGRSAERGWAAGLGLERFAMKLFGIPDVRLFWSLDPRFLTQFRAGAISQFKEFSKYPVCYKDISLWVGEGYNPNDLFEIIREVGGDLIENVEETMTYTDPKSAKVSKAYRISFRSLERTLGNAEITDYQMKIRSEIVGRLKTVTLR